MTTPLITIIYYRVHIVVIDRDGHKYDIKGKIGDNLLYLAHRYNIDMEGVTLLYKECCYLVVCRCVRSIASLYYMSCLCR